MKLSAEQEQAVRSWVQAGAGLAEVQKRLAEEHGLKLTFLDTRFLVDDLKLTVVSPEKLQSQAAKTPAKTPAETDADADAWEDEGDAPASPAPSSLLNEHGQAPKSAAGQGVRVSLDDLAIPGTLVSGKVTFSDGQSGRWYLDEMGRLGFDGATPGYRPSEEDLVVFQRELQNLMRRQGF